MAHIRSTASLLVLSASISWGQQASLSGVVRDREDKSPIRGAEVKVGSKVGGITGADGKYVVSDLPRGAKVEVAYTKQGYGSRIEKIVLKDKQIREDVALFKNTADAVYWSSWSDKLRKEVQARGSGPRSQSEEYVRQWKEVQEGGLTNEAKNAAARQLITVFPSQSAVPADLQACAMDAFREEANQDQTVYAHAQLNGADQRRPAGNTDQVAENKQQIDADHHTISNGGRVKIVGVITARNGENLTLKNVKDQTSVVVELTDSTKVQTPEGLGLRSGQSATALIPGLKIQVRGNGDDSRVVAENIKFSNSDLLLAETIQAGLTVC